MSGAGTTSVERRISRYVEEGLGAVTGWFETESAEVIASLLRHQLTAGTQGDVAEIGVHHGKSFLLLANGVRPDERAVALDVFDDQHLNVDQSGKGDRAVFERNVAAWADPDRVVVVQGSSTDVAPDRAVETFGHVRLFSVDGGHTSGITCHDLRLAEACLVDDGVVVLDDIFNPHWLGVLSGLRDYLATSSALRPFAVSANKLYLARPDATGPLVAHLREDMADLLGKPEVEFFGALVDVYGMGSQRRRRAAAEAAARAKDGSAQEQQLRRDLQEGRTRLATVQRELEEARRALVACRQAAVDAQRRVDAMTGSTSWRVTAPVRAAGGWVKARRRG
ncbi:class I SAM-dependent methyltransferase [Nocardioides sp. ChNu-153]|uniref:class I SAM-dependent methyltransferase n=1 Tax=Nocardioides sp. ChNu-153 TaxID=2779364 RepID=UPI00264AA414|nr:class I SAM-dependent methyltransferase [Nocardioides sp. ChNu-153]MDN7123115.1 class I SAM-dependent methyltransferase [Nocardioides sp. ChNu-153]